MRPKEISIYRIDVQIHISHPESKGFDIYNLHNEIESLLELNTSNKDPKSNKLKQYIIKYFKENTISNNIKPEDPDIKPIITNYQERSGSLIVSFTMILITALTTYNSIREALERILEDFGYEFDCNTENRFITKSNISYIEELYSENKNTKQYMKNNPNLSSQNTGINLDDCIKIMQNINNQNDKQCNRKTIINYICIIIAVIATVSFVFEKYYNNDKNIRDIVNSEMEKYKTEEKISNLSGYYQFQQYFSIYKANESTQKANSIK